MVEVAQEYSARGLSEKQLETMTGRTVLWKAGIAMFLDSPILDTVTDAGVKMGGMAFGIQKGSHMHNSHLQILVNNGIVGYLAWFAMVASVTWMMFIRLFCLHWPLRLESDRFHAETIEY